MRDNHANAKGRAFRVLTAVMATTGIGPVTMTRDVGEPRFAEGATDPDHIQASRKTPAAD